MRFYAFKSEKMVLQPLLKLSKAPDTTNWTMQPKNGYRRNGGWRVEMSALSTFQSSLGYGERKSYAIPSLQQASRSPPDIPSCYYN